MKGKNNDSSGVDELFAELKREADRLIGDLKELKLKYT
jgi:hypothetical protein